ncbi:DUF4225 domain-containing protein [Pseudomonas quasicaspiana]|nr:DUF4225 domain-containing protein [Pseudomonas quasicaspiana]
MADPKSKTSENKQLKQAAVALTNHACTLSMQHIQDGMLRLQFNREVAYYAQGIVRDVEGGRKSVAEGVEALEGEQQSLLGQVGTYSKQVFGLLAGGLQVTGGFAMCGGTVGLGCGVGLFIAAQGANNIYESGNNIFEGRTDTEGPMRNGYQAASRIFGGSDYEGNMAYGTADLMMSGWGLFRLIPKKDSWRLYRYIRSDKEIALKQTRKWILGIDVGADISTTHNMSDEWKKNHD